MPRISTVIVFSLPASTSIAAVHAQSIGRAPAAQSAAPVRTFINGIDARAIDPAFLACYPVSTGFSKFCPSLGMICSNAKMVNNRFGVLINRESEIPEPVPIAIV